MTDLLLAMAHHLLVFSLAAIIAAEAVLVRPGMTNDQLRLIANLDRWYGVLAVLILVVGFGRVYYGIRGPAFFLTNPWFHAKLAAFVIVGILSAPPTIRFIAWRRRVAADEAATVTTDEILRVRRFLIAEVIVFAFIPLFAAAMVRVPYLAPQ